MADDSDEEIQNPYDKFVEEENQLRDLFPSLDLQTIKKSLRTSSGKVDLAASILLEHPVTMSKVTAVTKTSLPLNDNTLLKKVDEKYISILRDLSLGEVSSYNFGLRDLLKITRSSLNENEPLSLKEHILHVISKQVMLDYRARNIQLCITNNQIAENTETRKSNDDKSELDMPKNEIELDSDDDDDESLRMELSGGILQKSSNLIHPSDAIVIIMNCCDNVLRQIIVQKMAVCQLAIPLVLPDLYSTNPLFLLWSMRIMTMNWKTQVKEAQDIQLDDFSTPIVSAIRFGDLSKSKSKILNNLLSDQPHDIFFHRDCESGYLSRKLSVGVIELAWYIPGGKKEDSFDSTIALTNLRADAKYYNKQFQFLSAMSSVMLVFLSLESIYDNECFPMLKELSTSNHQLVFIFLDTVSEQNYSNFAKIMGNKKFKTVLGSVNGQAKNASLLKTELRTKISKSLKKHQGTENTTEQLNLKTIGGNARSMGITVDEDSKSCQDGKGMANIIMKELQSYHDITTRKKQALPLQGEHWLEWAKLTKKQARLDEHEVEGKNHVKYIADLDNKKEECRKKQCNLVKDMAPVMKMFIENLKQTKENPDTRLSFMQWMKLHLDVISQKELPELQKRYHSLWNDKQEQKRVQKDTINGEEIKKIQNKIDEVESNLIASSLGLEHFMREIGQIYEAIVDNKDDTFNRLELLKILPQFAADLLRSGFPLEIMDGDASHMPLTWVKAVFDCLKNGLKDKKVFVISVLGVQSSGKSTLLNTMFGLNFSVSAGRCTKGVFAQLITVEDNLSDDLNISNKLKYDYILILDTEGLRAPELGNSKLSHDNELATLVIGLGDVTIVNIKGENTAEIEDILQISVHAFLRMQLVNKNLKVKRSCYFVHQNVPAKDAAEKMLYGYEKIQEQLDFITKAAAEQEEHANDIKCFKDVIEFDVKKNVWYFSNLWQGDPPMAPANPSYSEKVMDLKTHLLNYPSQKDLNCLTFTDLQVRLTDLWKAILYENFVFSFKNSLELQSYQNLEEKYSLISWEFRKKVKEMMNANVNEILSCSENNMVNLHETIIISLSTHIEEIHTECKKDLNTFFKASRDKEILAQWKSNTELRLLSLHNELNDEAEKNCKTHFAVREAHFVRKNKTESYKEQLEMKVKELVNTNAEEKTSPASLNDEFNVKWKEWMNTLKFDKFEEKDIKGDVLTILPKYFKSYANLLQNVIASYGNIENYVCNLDITPYINEEHYKLKPHLMEKIQNFFSGGQYSMNHMIAKKEIKEFTRGMQKEIELYIKGNDSQSKLKNDSNESKAQDYDKTMIYTVCKMINDKVKLFNGRNHPYELTIQYKIKVTVHIFRNVIPLFKNMHSDYRNENDPQQYLDKELKPTLRKFFVETVTHCKQEKTAAGILITSLEKAIFELLKRELPQTVADKVKEEFHQLFNAKVNLHAKVMEDLGTKTFSDYVKFLDEPNEYMQNWLKYLVRDNCSKIDSNKNSYLKNIVNEKLENVISILIKHVKEANKSVDKETGIRFKTWLLKYHVITRHIVPFDDDLFGIYGIQKVKDVEYFEEWIIKGLENMKTNSAKLKELFIIKNMEDGNGEHPHELLANNILGCTEKCPFCYAICTLTIAGHAGSHNVINHRPQAIGGYRDRNTKEMTLETCSMQVAGNGTFACRDYSCICWKDDGQRHTWKDHSKVYTSWDITPDTSKEGSAYWKWMFCKFTKDLEKHYRAICTDMPNSWKTIGWDEAKKSILNK